MHDTAWLNDLKPGDKVIVESGRGEIPYIGVVERLTKTQILVQTNDHGYISKFRLSSGSEINGDKWWHVHLNPWSEDAETKIRNNEMRRSLQIRCRDQNWKDLTTDELCRVASILDESKARKEKEDESCSGSEVHIEKVTTTAERVVYEVDPE